MARFLPNTDLSRAGARERPALAIDQAGVPGFRARLQRFLLDVLMAHDEMRNLKQLLAA